MWTPKRIVILSGCFVAFFLAYLGYAYTAIGRIDGLPPLPEIYHPGLDPAEIPTTIVRNPKLPAKIRMVFGNDAKELKWAIRLDVQRNKMLLAAEQFEPTKDGRVCLSPLSIAFLKEKGPNQPPEINTIRGDVAYLKFDRPVTNFSEIASRKIVEAELSGKIEVVNNRQRLERDEDLRVTIPTGTLYYREADHRITTEAYVILEDFKSKPHPHKIKGKGMEMQLLTETPPSKPGQRKPARESITGVQWITLRSAVQMDLYLDGNAGWMATSPQKKTGTPMAGMGKQASNRSHLRITTPGQFRYEIHKDHDVARFDVQPSDVSVTRSEKAPPRQPEHVVALRKNLESNLEDQLVCHQLTLQLRRKDSDKSRSTSATKGENGNMDSLQIESVQAKATTGKRVVLLSNAERVVAYAQDMFHDSLKELTLLKGEVEVERDESKLRAREVCLQNVKPSENERSRPGTTPPRAYQHLTAKGPGDIMLVDAKEKKTLRAYWQTLLTSTREGDLDLLTLTGEARFIDEDAQQTLQGDVLKVWLEEVDKKATSGKNETATDSRRPRHLEATGNVIARSRDMNVHNTSRLVVWFKDAPVPAEQLPVPHSSPPVKERTEPVKPKPNAVSTTSPASGNAIPPTGPVLQSDSPAVPRPLPAGPEQATHQTSKPRLAAGPPSNSGPDLKAPESRPTNRPFDLSARSVEAWVIRGANKNSLDQLWCEGTVLVRQDPARAEEKGTEVKGETLRMLAAGEGLYHLVVTGDLAELQTDKIYIIGPEVNIDQATNKAWVVGDGAMKMESKTNFRGEPLARPVPLTVQWNNSMLFNGESAEFYGNIQAVQEKARLACQRLQVYFDKPISLRQGNKTNDPAQVKNLVCSRDVRIEDSVFEGERLIKYQRLEGPGVQMMALEPDDAGKPANGKPRTSAGNVVYASGPGTIRIWEPGIGEDPLHASKPDSARAVSAKPGGSPRPETRMTYVAFEARMDANSKSNTASFWKNVRVLHIPAATHDKVIDLDLILAADLPEKSLYLRCERLKVLDYPEGGKPNKQMEAHGKVYAQGREFYARADSLYYNQLKQQIILVGNESGNAVLYKVSSPGARPETVEGKKITYNRATGKVEVQGVGSVTGESVPRK